MQKSHSRSSACVESNGDWTRAHESAQADEGSAGSWVHAYLHRKEGDQAPRRPGTSSTFLINLEKLEGCKDCQRGETFAEFAEIRKFDPPIVEQIVEQLWNGNQASVFLCPNSARYFKKRAHRTGQDDSQQGERFAAMSLYVVDLLRFARTD